MSVPQANHSHTATPPPPRDNDLKIHRLQSNAGLVLVPGVLYGRTKASLPLHPSGLLLLQVGCDHSQRFYWDGQGEDRGSFGGGENGRGHRGNGNYLGNTSMLQIISPLSRSECMYACILCLCGYVCILSLFLSVSLSPYTHTYLLRLSNHSPSITGCSIGSVNRAVSASVVGDRTEQYLCYLFL